MAVKTQRRIFALIFSGATLPGRGRQRSSGLSFSECAAGTKLFCFAYNGIMAHAHQSAPDPLVPLLAQIEKLSLPDLRRLWKAVHDRAEQIDEDEWESTPGAKEELEEARRSIEEGDVMELSEYLRSRGIE